MNKERQEALKREEMKVLSCYFFEKERIKRETEHKRDIVNSNLKYLLNDNYTYPLVWQIDLEHYLKVIGILAKYFGDTVVHQHRYLDIIHNQYIYLDYYETIVNDVKIISSYPIKKIKLKKSIFIKGKR